MTRCDADLKVVFLAMGVPVPNEAAMLLVMLLVGPVESAVTLPEAIAVPMPEYEIVEVPEPPAMENNPL